MNIFRRNPNDDNPPSEEYFREKIKSSDKSGLMNKLNDNLHFDIEAMMERSNQDKFDGLKVLKMLYYIEKDGNPKKSKSEFGDIFDAMVWMVEKNISDVAKKIHTMKKLNARWEDATDGIFDYVISDYTLDMLQPNMVQLERINTYITDNIIKKCEEIKPREVLSGEGLMESFYNLLLCHQYLCNERYRQLGRFLN